MNREFRIKMGEVLAYYKMKSHRIKAGELHGLYVESIDNQLDSIWVW